MRNPCLLTAAALLLTACGAEERREEPPPATAGAGVETVGEAADAVLRNGRIYTVNQARPWAEAVAVRGSEIVYVGDDSGAAALVGEDTEEIDLEGRLVLPGFVESHIHIMLGGAATAGLHLTIADSVEDVLRKLGEYAAANPTLPTLFGASYNSRMFGPEGRTKAMLDAVVPDRPVILLDDTLHSAWVNTKALEAAGITKDTPDPPGGEYVRDPAGEATGAIDGGPAHLPVLLATDAISSEAMTQSVPAILEALSEFGFTSAMDLGNPIATEAALQAMVDLDNEGKLPLRLSATYYVNTPELAETAVETLDGFAKRYRSDHFWLDTLKIVGDSVLENQAAAMLEPYDSTGERGTLYFEQNELDRMAIGAAELGYHTIIHACGDRATRAVLDTAEAVREAGHDDTIVTGTHVEMVHPDDAARFGALNVIAQTTPNWAVTYDSMVAHLGVERYQTRKQPFRRWVDGGAVVSLGADFPATPGGMEFGVNPFNNIYAAMHRSNPPEIRHEFASSPEPLPPLDEVLTLEEAIRGYTINGAIQLGIEDQVGSIEVGKKADLILLSQNLFEIDPADIPRTTVLATMFDGEVVHDVVYELGDDERIELDDLDLEIEEVGERPPS